MRAWWCMVLAIGCGTPPATHQGGRDPGNGQSTDTGLVAGSDTAEPGDSLSTESGTKLFTWCERWIECGGTWYETPQDCVDATYAYWGECEAVVSALDDFAECMVDVPCSAFDADTFDPAESPCAGLWPAVVASACAE
jgi:hypothetical protein